VCVTHMVMKMLFWLQYWFKKWFYCILAILWSNNIRLLIHRFSQLSIWTILLAEETQREWYYGGKPARDTQHVMWNCESNCCLAMGLDTPNGGSGSRKEEKWRWCSCKQEEKELKERWRRHGEANNEKAKASGQRDKSKWKKMLRDRE
jgi:hypothetical protein